MALRGLEPERCAGCQFAPTLELAGFSQGGIALRAVRWFCGVDGYRFGNNYGCAIAVPIAVVLATFLLCIVTTYFLSVWVALWRDRNLRSCSGVRWVLHTSCFFTYVALLAVKNWMKMLLLVSFLSTLITGLLRAEGIANTDFVDWAMDFDLFGFLVIAIILGLLAARPELADVLWNIAARLMRHPDRNASSASAEAQSVLPERASMLLSQIRSGAYSQSPKKLPITHNRAEILDNVISSFLDQLKAVGNELIGKNWITQEDVDSSEWSFVVGLPAVILFRCLMRSAAPGVTGIKLANGEVVTPDFGNFGQRQVIQAFCSLRDEVRQTSLSPISDDLIQRFERKLLRLEDGPLAPFEDIKKGTWADICSHAPNVNMVFSKINGTTISLTQLKIFKENFRVFANQFHPFPASGLFVAAQKGNLDEVQRLLSEYKYNVDERSQRGATPLISAAMFGQVRLVQHLLDRKADVNAQTDQKKTALWCAACNGHCDVVEALLKANADQNICAYDPSGNSSPLKVAQLRGKTEVEGILRKHAEPSPTAFVPIQSMNDATFGEWSTLQDQAQEEPLVSTVSFNPTIDD